VRGSATTHRGGHRPGEQLCGEPKRVGGGCNAGEDPTQARSLDMGSWRLGGGAPTQGVCGGRRLRAGDAGGGRGQLGEPMGDGRVPNFSFMSPATSGERRPEREKRAPTPGKDVGRRR
jgi:hypothetical protein